MLTCRQVTEDADRYLEADLPWRRRLQVRLHLVMCRHCRRYVDQLARTVAMLRALPAPPLEAGAEDRALAAVAAARAAKARGGDAGARGL